ncbi:MAG: bifunctional 2-keto-4-hydroxyglutarate aldolase/2-keto-3-deoxy-6-phosphogluconate aldolase [Peptostreptococcaceae bacterium]
MKKYEILKGIEKTKLVAVVRADNFEQGVKICNTCIDGGIEAVEVTYTTPNATDIIKSLDASYPGKLIGAGTVLDSTTATIAINAGAKFIVSPFFDEEIAKTCNIYHIPYLPGCMSIKEMVESTKSGVDVIKLFPASNFGPKMIKAVNGPLPDLKIMPTGGINKDNVIDWLNEGVFAAGMSGNLLSLARKNDFETMKNEVEELVDIVNKWRV